MLGARDAGRCPPKGRTSLLVLYYDSRAIPVVVSQRECAAAARLAPVAVAPAFARGAPKAALRAPAALPGLPRAARDVRAATGHGQKRARDRAPVLPCLCACVARIGGRTAPIRRSGASIRAPLAVI